MGTNGEETPPDTYFLNQTHTHEINGGGAQAESDNDQYRDFNRLAQQK